MDFDLSKVADGLHALQVEVKEGERPLGTVSLRMSLQKGLDGRLRQLDANAAAAPAEIRPDSAVPR